MNYQSLMSYISQLVTIQQVKQLLNKNDYFKQETQILTKTSTLMDDFSGNNNASGIITKQMLKNMDFLITNRITKAIIKDLRKINTPDHYELSINLDHENIGLFEVVLVKKLQGLKNKTKIQFTLKKDPSVLVMGKIYDFEVNACQIIERIMIENTYFEKEILFFNHITALRLQNEKNKSKYDEIRIIQVKEIINFSLKHSHVSHIAEKGGTPCTSVCEEFAETCNTLKSDFITMILSHMFFNEHIDPEVFELSFDVKFENIKAIDLFKINIYELLKQCS